ncbi:ROK family protein [Enterococcus gallinarum]|uniref:ROK family protein n=1 Tax=Enterococcus gallinarum TaxID=1353 RepID=UPI0012E25C0E|nr:ROK family protein [Enterococcus gallinarum]
MDQLVICLDVGGTFVKGTVYNNKNKPLLEGINYYPAHANKGKEEILENFFQIMSDLYQQVAINEKIVQTLMIAFPGPFDYEQGICLIQGLNKYESLYQTNIKHALRQRIKHSQELLTTTDFSISIFNDGTAFAFGEYASQSFAQKKGIYIAIGTGCGSTFIKNGEMIRGVCGIPRSGMIFNEPYKEGVIDDYLSARGLEQMIEQIIGEKLSPKTISDRAKRGDQAALAIFNQFGHRAAEILTPYARLFHPDEIVFGGQISKSFEFMETGILAVFTKENIQTTIRATKDTSKAVIQGLNTLKIKKAGL